MQKLHVKSHFLLASGRPACLRGDQIHVCASMHTNIKTIGEQSDRVERAEQKKMPTCASVCTASANKKFAGYASKHCRSLSVKNQLGGSLERKTRVLTVMAGPLTIDGQLMEIEWKETEQNCDCKKCGSCRLRSKAAAAIHHR